ncbi:MULTISPECIES: hypothetical protein [Actinosynnema]|uniref:hypothetical protein n=1 Tax=Actinosynnema TaxID=40566 RepID=UPI0020A3ECAB|nr:hypothetical protein [Actinosynnema pretiosum]
METPLELQEISDASDFELMLICTAVAERGAAFCRALGPSECLTWVDGALGLAWAAAAGESVQDECPEALDELEMESQDDEDDYYGPEFYLTQAVELVGNALAASMRPSAVRVEMSVNTIRTLLSMLDFEFSGEVSVIVGYGETPPPSGLLVQKEIDAEREVLFLLAQVAEGLADARPVVSQVQASSSAFAARLVPAVEQFAALSGWEL